MWKVRADCTYTTAANKTSRQTAVEGMMASYPEAIIPTTTLGRFAGGIISQSTTRFTVAFDFTDEAQATAFAAALHTSLAAAARAQTLVSIHEAS